MNALKPFWNYYGGKWRAAPSYPAPVYGTIVEPFAGAAGYALRYPNRNVILVEKYPVVAGIWRYLINVSAEEIRRIPLVESVDELPARVPQEARALVGFCLNNGAVSPRKTLSSGLRKLRTMGRHFTGWSAARRERVARQVNDIGHWQIIEGDYTLAPNCSATWFIDPPYQLAGAHYIHHEVNYHELATWCRSRRGQIIVCENTGTDWLPFEAFRMSKGGPRGSGVSSEAIWQADNTP